MSLLQAMQEAPTTIAELAQDIGYSVDVVQMRVRALRDAGVIHVAAWDRPKHKGTTVARWAFGPGVDVPRPKRQSKKAKNEYQRAYHVRRRTAELMGLRAA